MIIGYFGMGLLWASFANWMIPGLEIKHFIKLVFLWPFDVLMTVFYLIGMVIDFILGRFSE